MRTRATADFGQRQRVLVSLWLCIWVLANLALFSPFRWILAAAGLMLLISTWGISQLQLPGHLGLNAISLRDGGRCLLAGTGFFAVVWFISVFKRLAVFGYVPPANALWASLVSPVNEEVVFRGLLYGLVVAWPNRIGFRRAAELTAIVVAGILFAIAHHRASVFFVLTLAAGLLYGVARWKTNSVMGGILCHVAYNMIALLAFGRQMS